MFQVSRQWFDEFVADTRGELTGYLQRMLRSREDALEVSQEAYLKVYVALCRHEKRQHSPKALLYTTARNVAISRLRHQKIVDHSLQAVTVSQELQSERRSPEQHASKNDDLQSLLYVINQLPPKCRQVILLRMLEGLSQKEIAAKLDIAVSTVEKHLAKALRSSNSAMRQLRQDQQAQAATARRALR